MNVFNLQNMVYLIVDENKTFCKIGYTENLKERFQSLQDGNPLKLFVLCAIEGDREVESCIHQKFIHLHKRGEWFLFLEEIYEFFKKDKIEGFTPYSQVSQHSLKKTPELYTQLLERISFPACASDVDKQIMNLLNKSENTARKIRQRWEQENKITFSRKGKEIICTKTQSF